MTVVQDATMADLQRQLDEYRVERDAALARETALAEVISVINRSPDNPEPVFEAILDKAHSLCGVAVAALFTYDGQLFRAVASRGIPEPHEVLIRQPFPPGRYHQQLIDGERLVHIPDLKAISVPPDKVVATNTVNQTDVRTLLAVPLRKDGTLIGHFSAARLEVRPFSDSEIALLESFAAQAVIAVENARLLNEQREALEHQTATAEVLSVINANPGNLAPVFHAILEKAHSLCGAVTGALTTYDGTYFRAVATRGYSEAHNALIRQPFLPNMHHRALLRGERFAHLLDVRAGPPEDNPITRSVVENTDMRTNLTVPLRKDDVLLGFISAWRREVQAFSGTEIALLENFAAQAVIAMDNARLLIEQREALERQTATAEVLQVINASPGQLKPVFDAILERAMRLCGAAFGLLATYDGESFVCTAGHGLPPALQEFTRQPITLATEHPDSALSRAVRGIDVIHEPDIVSNEIYRSGIGSRRALADLGGARTRLMVALRRDKVLLGVINVYRIEVRPFSDKQITLLQDFAAQAVIAMESARLLNEQQEALERQTAMAEVLQVINTSPGNLAPVFDAMLEKAMRLCGAAFGSFYTYDGERLHSAAHRGVPPEYAAHRDRHPPRPVPGGGTEATLRTRRPQHFLDVKEHELYRAGDPGVRAMVELGGIRTILTVPLVKGDEFLGYFSVHRQEVRAFSEKQIALLESFAAQAVIAMENARLLEEQREALERQTATAEVLGVINANPGNLAPVFEVILEKAHSICGAAKGALNTFDGKYLRSVATRGISEAFERMLREPRPRVPGSPLDQLMNGTSVWQIADCSTDTHPVSRAAAEIEGIRTILFVPLRRDGALFGIISAYRQEVLPFSDRQIALLQDFAAQAVIAMENARLITEQREALERQTATTEVLQIINANPGNLAPVFTTILDKALHLSDAAFGIVSTYDGELFHVQADHNIPPSLQELASRGVPPTPGTMLHRLVMGESVAHLADIRDDDAYRSGEPTRVAIADLGGARTQLLVALRKDDALLGAITVFRTEVRPFTPAQIALLESFAAQAVIAMENARLLDELRARTEALAQRNSEYSEQIAHQSATIDVLKAMSASPSDAQPVFDLIVQRAAEISSAPNAVLFRFDGEMVHWVATSGADTYHSPEAYEAILRRFPMPPSRNSAAGRVILNKRIVHIRDVDADPEIYQALRDIHTRSLLSVPLLRDGEVLGVLGISAREAGGFSDSQVALLETFAEQAVIAIRSAETFQELQARTEALTRRNSEYGEQIEHQSATIDVLKAMSASPGDAQPVFDVIVRHALHACNGRSSALFAYDGDLVHPRAVCGGDAAAIATFQATFPRPPKRDFLVGRAILNRETIHVRDTHAEPELSPAVRAMGGRTTLSMPLLRDGQVIGAMSLNASEPGGFSDSQVELLRTFAEQAVIAITSAETYRALQDRTEALARRNSEYGERIEHQSATIDVLKAISTSAGDDQPVLQLIARRARALCNAETVGVFAFDGQLISIRFTDSVDMKSLEPYVRVFPCPPKREHTIGRAILDRAIIEIDDADADPDLAAVVHARRNRSIITLPFIVNDCVVGGMSIAVRKPGGLTDSQKSLARILAEQASIAIGAATTMKQLQDRTATLTRSVAELQALEEVLRAVNSSLDLDTVLSTIISRAVQLSDADQGTIYEFDVIEQVFVPKAAFGMTAEGIGALRDRRIRIGETPLGISAADRTPLHIPDLTQRLDIDGSRELLGSGMRALLAVPLLRNDTVVGGLVIRRRAVGGFAPSIPTLLQTFAGQCVLAIENARLFQEARQARSSAETALADLRRAQDRLIQAEKMASLGQLTAGIAHEIKNPLNFVNNFADLSVELLNEMKAAVSPALPMLDADKQAEVDEVLTMVTGNLAKITEHGRRADGIVRSMLEHSRGGSGDRRRVDLNTLVEEALNLAYHGARAQDQTFNITQQRDFADGIAPIELVPQDITRVLLNLISNGFYAARNRRRTEPAAGFEPTLKVRTRDLGDAVEIVVRDNGTGIPAAVKDKLFQPFFTTKPTGEGTGLGLSISYDIVTKQHGGAITVESKVGDYSEFTIRLPRNP